MLKNSQKISISKHFLIPLLFILLMFTSFGVNMDDVCAHDLNQSTDGIASELNIEDKLENSQENMVQMNVESDDSLSVDQGSEILGRTITPQGDTFQSINDAIERANEGDTIKLSGTYYAQKAYDQIRVNKKISFTADSRATLDGKGLTQIVRVEKTASETSFNNLKFVNAYFDGTGGAIFIRAKDVHVNNCIFENNTAYQGSGISTTNSSVMTQNLLVENCQFIDNYAKKTAAALSAYANNTRIVNCIFDSNKVYNGTKFCYGGAIQIGLDDFVSQCYVYGCKFYNNYVKAVSESAHGGAGCVRDGTVYENCIFVNNSAGQGGALTYHGSGLIKNCTFANNTAYYYGGALSTGYNYIDGDLKIENCHFYGNDAPIGGAVQLTGENIKLNKCDFYTNHASQTGGAINIDAETVNVANSKFNRNIANVDGGAVFINGKSTSIKDSSFNYNEAIPDVNRLDDGLGGAIYINSTQAFVEYNEFYFNTARNGSAIYYDKYGSHLKLTHNTFYQNQAWVYALPIYANDIYYGETESIGSVIHGGNNIAKYGNLAVSNAIYNAANNNLIKIDGEIPVLGATASGQLYQDDREYNMKILLTVVHEDGTVVYNKTLYSDCFGEVKDSLVNLKAGKYYVTAKHDEDTYYKAITNKTSFRVIPKVDDEVKKSVSSENLNYNDLVVWTLNITNNGPSNATGVVVKDVLPAGLEWVRDNTNGKYNPQTGVLRLDSLKVGEVFVVTIITKVKKTGEITNNVNITANEHDYNLTNNHDQSKIKVNPASDLAVVKSVNASTVNLHDSIKWTITVSNNGPDTATGVVAKDLLPKSLIWISDDSNGKYNRNTGEWNIGTLNKGGSTRLNIVCRVNATGSIKNQVSVTGNEYDWDKSNNNASKTVNVNPASDLGIVKVVSPGTVNYRDVVCWTLTVSNYGPDAATGVKIYDTLPAGFVYINSTKPYSNGAIDIGNLAVGASVSVKIHSRATVTGNYVNVASVKGNEFDQNPSNNKNDASIVVKPATDLQVTKTSNVSAVNLHDLVKWTITVKNNGPDTATGVSVNDLLPKSLIWVSDDSNGKYNHNTGVWSIGTLNKGSSINMNIISKVNATGSIKNSVSVTGNEYDWDKSNNNATKTITVAKASDLGIVKVVSPGTVNYRDVVCWTLTVSNYGPDAATGVKVYDTLPDGFVYINSTKPLNNGVIDIGNLAVGQSVSVKIYSRANITGNFVNVASVKGNEFDQNPANNKGSASIVVKPATDLQVTKSANVSAVNLHDLVKWTITVKNNGPDTATGVSVKDLLAKSLIWVSDDSNGKYNHNTGVWNVGTLNKAATAKLNIVSKVNATGAIKNSVSVTGNEFDWDKSNNNATKTIAVAKASDLGIVKVVSPGTVNYRDVVCWTLTVSNYGPDAATGVKVYDTLPEGFVYINSTIPFSNGVMNIGNLAVGQSVSVKVYARANITGTHVNVASVKGNEFDQNPSNDKSDVSIVVKPATDLQVTKSANVSTVNLHDLVKWTITVKNNGPDTATGVNVKELLAKSLIWVSDDSNGKYNHNTGVWNVGTLNKAATVKLNIVCKVNATGTIKNSVSVTGNEFDWDKSNNNNSKNINVNPASDLGIVKVVSPGTVNYRDVVCWTLTVSNYGPDAATGVKVYDTLPEGFVYINSTIPFNNGVMNIGSLAVGQSVSVKVYARANITGTHVNVASVKGNEFDQNSANNKGNASIVVKPAANLEITKSVNDSEPNFADIIKWTISVVNRGPDAATGVVVKESLPQYLIWIEDDSHGKYNHDAGIWNVGNINNGEMRTLTILTKVNGTGSFVNNVSTTANEFDWNKTNNNDNESIKVANASDLSVIKLANQSVVDYHHLLDWTIIVKNNGPNKATGVLVEDILPEGLELINYTASKGFYDNGIWSVCCLEKGENQTLTLTCFVNKTGKLTNTVKVEGNEYDHNLSNNNNSATVLVPKSSDLAVVKNVDNSNPNFGEEIVWSITVTNNGPDDSDDVLVIEELPEGLEIIDYTCSSGNYGEGMWFIDHLDNGASESLVIRCIVKTLEDIENIANVVPSQYDWDESNNNDNESITVNPLADLSIVKSVNVSTANYLDLVRWTLMVSNYGPNDASGVFVYDVIPKGLTVVDVYGDGIYKDSVWHIGDLANGESRYLDIICKIHSTGEFKNVASVWGDEMDPDVENNEDENYLYVGPASDLSITKTVSKYRYVVGDVVNFSIRLTNNGPDAAKNVNVREIMDDSLKLVSYHASAGDFDKVNDVWSLDLLGAGQSAYLQIKAIANKAGMAVNTVVATSDNYDPDLSNNNDTVSVDVAEKENPNNASQNSNQKSDDDEKGDIYQSILEKYVSGNPIMVIILLFVFTMGALYGNTILKKR